MLTSLKNLLGAATCADDEGGWVVAGEGREGGGRAEEGRRRLSQGHRTCKPTALTPKKLTLSYLQQ